MPKPTLDFSPNEGYVVKRLMELPKKPGRMLTIASEMEIQACSVREYVRRAMAKRGYSSITDVDDFLEALKRS